MSESSSPRSHRMVANGLDHHVLEWAGTSDHLGVALLLHGFQDAAVSFDLVAPALTAEGFRVFAPDLRGFGDTERVGKGGYYHFPDYVFDVADLVDTVSPHAPIFLVGHSMGGTVATLYAGSFPERVALLALLEGIGPPDMPVTYAPDRTRTWIDGVRKVRARVERAMSLDEAMRRLAINHPNVDKAVLRARAQQLTEPAVSGAGITSKGESPREGSAERVWRFDPLHRTSSPIGFARERLVAHAQRITAPTLVVGGGATGFHPEDEALRIEAFAEAHKVDLEGAGHMMHWTQPSQLSRVLLAFVRGDFS
ncbi:MAG: alpha/beta hydrolase [Polyangiales bacterium]